jgi:hypothetical protein
MKKPLKSAEEIRREKTEMVKCNINTIIEGKKRKLNGYGIQRADRTLALLYRMKKTKAPDIEIFEGMVEIARILKEHTSKTRGNQQKLLGT